ncbi:MAG: hypothetical protein DMF66_16130, partial [Acidobacteria bacterium]
MRYKIAHDARPQAKALLAAAALGLALWFVPYAWVLAYPFKLFVTFIHEGGHALAAVLTGNSVQSLSVSFDTSGLTETLTPRGSYFSQMLISSAGYLTAIGCRRVKARVVLVGSAVVIAALTVVFGFLVPLTNLSFSPFTVVSGVLIAAGLLAAARYASRPVANFLVSFLAVQCVLGALYDLRNLFLLSVSSDAPTDAGNMANIFPAWLWPLSTSIF